MLVIQDQKHFDEVVAFATKIDLYEQEHNNASLKSRLDYLEKYGGENSHRMRVHLMRDSAPYSFYFSIEKQNDGGEWERLFEGGLLYHGPPDGFGSGSAPTLAVTLTPTTGWSIHT